MNKLIIFILLLLSSGLVFSKTMVLISTYYNGEPVVDKFLLKSTDQGYLISGFRPYTDDVPLKLISEDPHMLVLSHTWIDYVKNSPYRELVLFVIHKADEVFSYEIYSINHHTSIPQTIKELSKSESRGSGHIVIKD